jgi:hypothetical protein
MSRREKPRAGRRRLPTAVGRAWRALALAAAIAIASLLAPGGVCQNAQCSLVYYTVTSTIYQTLTQVRTEVVTTTTYTTYTGTDSVTTVSPVSWTYTTTVTYVEVNTIVTPGGVLANLTCTWPTATVPPPPGAGSSGFFAPAGDVLGKLSLAVLAGLVVAAVSTQLQETAIKLLVVAAISVIMAAVGGAWAAAGYIATVAAAYALLFAYVTRKED